MRKNYFLIGVFALATITFAACSSEGKLGEERSDDNGNTEVIEGEPTWAKFTFVFITIEQPKLIRNIRV